MMTNFLSGILAVVFALTSLCGGVAGIGTEHPVTTEIGVALDGDLSMLTGSFGAGQSADAVGVIAKLFSALTIRLSADAAAGQMQVKLNGNPVASLSVQKQEDGWAVVSDLFPSTKLTVKNESLAAAIPAEGISLSALSGLPAADDGLYAEAEFLARLDDAVAEYDRIAETYADPAADAA